MFDVDDIENVLKFLLQRNIDIILRNKSLFKERYKVIFYTIKGFNVRLTLQNNKSFEFPYPFGIDHNTTKKEVSFLYHNKYIHFDDDVCKKMMKDASNNTLNKFYNSTLIISYV